MVCASVACSGGRGFKLKMTDNSRRYKGVIPLETVLPDVLTDVRRRTWEARSGSRSSRGFSQKIARLASREMMIIAKLRKQWPSLVGGDLAVHTFPERLFQQKLFIICEDSPWMQTFMFVRQCVLERINQMLPDQKIDALITRLGKLPIGCLSHCTSSWPDWQPFVKDDLPKISDASLKEKIVRCRAKLKVRRETLAKEGLIPCPTCGGVVVHIGTQMCASCRHEAEREKRMKLRMALSDSPWLAFEEVKERFPDVSLMELEAVKSDLLGEFIASVEELKMRFLETRDINIIPQLHLEMMRAVILGHGMRPDAVSPEEIEKLFPLEWKELLNSTSNDLHEGDEC